MSTSLCTNVTTILTVNLWRAADRHVLCCHDKWSCQPVLFICQQWASPGEHDVQEVDCAGSSEKEKRVGVLVRGQTFFFMQIFDFNLSFKLKTKTQHSWLSSGLSNLLHTVACSTHSALWHIRLIQRPPQSYVSYFACYSPGYFSNQQ